MSELARTLHIAVSSMAHRHAHKQTSVCLSVCLSVIMYVRISERVARNWTTYSRDGYNLLKVQAVGKEDKVKCMESYMQDSQTPLPLLHD